MELFDRAKELAIEAEFVDGQGHRHVTDEAALRIILDTMPASAAPVAGGSRRHPRGAAVANPARRGGQVSGALENRYKPEGYAP